MSEKQGMRISCRVMVVLLVLLCCGLLTASQQRRVSMPRPAASEAKERTVPAKAAAEFRLAREAFEYGDKRKAIRHLRRGLSIDPTNTEAYNNLGVLYYDLQQPGKAIEAFSTMIAIDPRCFTAYVNLAFTWYSQLRYEEAERVARRGVELRKTDPKIRFLLGMSLVAQQKLMDEAVDNLTMAAEEFPEARLELSRMLVEKGDFERATRELERFSEANKIGEKKTGFAPVQLFAK